MESKVQDQAAYERGKGIVSRRAFLKTVGASAAVVAVVGCSPAAAPTATMAPKAAVPTATTAPKAAVPTATTAPKAAAPTATTAPKPTEPPKPTATAVAKPKTVETIRFVTMCYGGDCDQTRKVHPWAIAMREFSDKNPHIKAEIQPQNEQPIGNWLAAGDPPEILRIGQARVMGAGVPTMVYALMLDVGPTMSKEDRADLGEGVLQGVRLKPNEKEFVMGWPLMIFYSQGLSANANILEEAGIKWEKYQVDGWTWEEFIDVCQKVADPGKKRVAFANPMSSNGFMISKLAEDAGQADFMDFGVVAEFGNAWNFQGPIVAQTAQYYMDWVNKYKITDLPHISLTQTEEMMDMSLKGEAVFNSQAWYYALSYPDEYNKKVKEGKLAGKPLDVKMATFPFPHHKDANSTSIARCNLLFCFKQQPYKGDAHSEATLEVVKLLTGTEIMTKVAPYENIAIPARKSVMKAVPQSNPQIPRMIEYSEKRLRWVHPYAHPATSKWYQVHYNASSDRLVNGKINAEQFEAECRKGGDEIMKDWLNTADKELIAYWEKMPPEYPGPMFPKWKQRTRQEAGY